MTRLPDRPARRRLLLPLILVLALAPAMAGPAGAEDAASAASVRTDRQKPVYREWLDLTAWIAHDEERRVFLGLENDRDRDLFIELFWRLRDPTPGTEENEFLIEHRRRFEAAGRVFRFGTTRPGWMTDMGRMLILLGEPDARERIESDSIVVPTQVWSYSGRGRPGLPAAFWLVFFRRGEVGEYRLYDPLADGPYVLLKKTAQISAGLDPADADAACRVIAERHEILARAARSLLPDEASAGAPSQASGQRLLARIAELARRGVSPSYATRFSRYKGIVQVEYAHHYVECGSTVALLRDPASGLHFVHFALRPHSVSVDFLPEKEEYFLGYTAVVSLLAGGKTVFAYRKSFPFRFREEAEARRLAAGVVVSDCFPVASGDFELRLMLQNEARKEFSFSERRLAVPEPDQPRPAVYGPLFSGGSRAAAGGEYRAWKVGGIELPAAPARVFSRTDEVRVLFGVDRCRAEEAAGALLEVEDIEGGKQFRRAFSLPLPEAAPLFYHVENLGCLPPGNYRARALARTAAGATLAAGEATFSVSLAERLPVPAEAVHTTAPEHLWRFYHAVAAQTAAMGRRDTALRLYEQAVRQKGDQPDLIRDFASLLLQAGESDRALALAEGLRGGGEAPFAYHAIRGKALSQKKETAAAIEALERANALYDSDVEVLNLLGVNYLRAGRPAEARRALQASLKIYPDQPQIAALAKKLE